MNGGAGDDLLQGGADPDLYVLSEGNDTIKGFYANDQLTWPEEWAWSADQAQDVYSTYERIFEFDFDYDYGYRLTFNADGSTDQPEHSIEIYTNLLIEEDFWPLPNADERELTYLGNVRKRESFKNNVGINFRGDPRSERIDFETLTVFAEEYADDPEYYRPRKGQTLPEDFASLESSLVMAVNALDGDDTVVGGVNGDVLFGGAGHDFINAGDGDDSVLGGHGDDTLKAYSGDDTLNGGAGDDLLKAGGGPDVYVLSTGNDTIKGFDENDLLTWPEQWAWNADQALEVYSSFQSLPNHDEDYGYGYRLAFNEDGSTDDAKHSIDIYTNLLIDDGVWPFLINASSRIGQCAPGGRVQK